jgi:hypothetical protein
MISASFMQVSSSDAHVRLRDGKEAVEQLKAMYPQEAKNVAALDIRTKLGAVSWHCNIKPALSITS